MLKIKCFLVLFSLFCFKPIFSQSVEILGRVKSEADVENIHVINKTAQVFTITKNNGTFNIAAKLNDTLVFSSIQYQPKEIIISAQIISNKAILVVLDEQINTLDEVVVGKVLTGDLMADIKNIDGKPPINFYDVGIPGYTGKPATQSERRLNEATTGAGIIPLNPIINAITGRTKMLKQRIKIEEKEELMQLVRRRLATDFFLSNPLEEDLKLDFFYFCADDKNFIKYCKNQTDFKILIFLRMKYRQYLDNLNQN